MAEENTEGTAKETVTEPSAEGSLFEPAPDAEQIDLREEFSAEPASVRSHPAARMWTSHRAATSAAPPSVTAAASTQNSPGSAPDAAPDQDDLRVLQDKLEVSAPSDEAPVPGGTTETGSGHGSADSVVLPARRLTEAEPEPVVAPESESSAAKSADSAESADSAAEAIADPDADVEAVADVGDVASPTATALGLHANQALIQDLESVGDEFDSPMNDTPWAQQQVTRQPALGTASGLSAQDVESADVAELESSRSLDDLQEALAPRSDADFVPDWGDEAADVAGADVEESAELDAPPSVPPPASPTVQPSDAPAGRSSGERYQSKPKPKVVPGLPEELGPNRPVKNRAAVAKSYRPVTKREPGGKDILPQEQGAGEASDSTAQPRVSRSALLIAAAGLGIVGAGYFLAQVVTAGSIPKGTSVAGLDVGGASVSDAAAAIQSAQGDLSVRFIANEQELSADANTLGVYFDPAAAADELGGFTLNPARLWTRMTGGSNTIPGGQQALDDITKGLSTFGEEELPAPVDAAWEVDGAAFSVVPGESGRAFDLDAAVTALGENWLSGAELELPTVEVKPDLSDAEVEAAIDTLARPVVEGEDLSVRGAGKEVTIEASRLGKALRVVSKEGEPALEVDATVLRDLIVASGGGLEEPPVPATFTIVDGKPQVVPDKPGMVIDLEDLASKAVAALSASGNRQVDIVVKEGRADLTAEEAAKLGVVERVSSASTSLASSSTGRLNNITVAARRINGTLVMPGETFSLNGHLGQRTAEKGYMKAPNIVGGRLVDAYGGGISQTAATLFMNVFDAGLEDIYHKPHSFYIGRYTPGKESTVSWPNLDMKWRNDSDYGVFITASISGGQLHMSFYSTKRYEIETLFGPRTNIRKPEKIVDANPDCIAQAPKDGFDIVVTRVFKDLNGAELRRERFATTYLAEDEVICKKKVEDTKPDRPGAGGDNADADAGADGGNTGDNADAGADGGNAGGADAGANGNKPAGNGNGNNN